MVWEEAHLVQCRENQRLISEAVLFQMALSTIPNSALKGGINKQASKEFERVIRSLDKG